MLGNLLEDTITLSFGGVPVAIGIAVLKYRRYDIDLIINRVPVYGLLTVMLAPVYFGDVTATRALLQTVTGQEGLPQLAVVVCTLVDRRPVLSCETAHSVLYRQAILQTEVRSKKGPRRVLCQAT